MIMMITMISYNDINNTLCGGFNKNNKLQSGPAPKKKQLNKC